ncbi:MAG: hypothetical protein WCP19_03225 [Chloroflexota bacterium]
MTRPNVQTSPISPVEFVQKLLLIFLLITDSAFCTYYLFKIKPGMNILLQIIFSDMLIGLLSGLMVRALFGKRSWIIKNIIGSSVLVFGLIFLGWLSGWKIGFGPLIFWRNTIDWRGLINISIGLSCMILALKAWNARLSRTLPEISQVVISSATVSNHVQAELQPLKIPSDAPVDPPAQRVITKNISRNTKARGGSLPIKKITGKGRKAKTNSKSIIHLANKEEHLCPYCLEPVTSGDVRGIVECQICHTLHHGDCWEITGACQVPHYTS